MEENQNQNQNQNEQIKIKVPLTVRTQEKQKTNWKTYWVVTRNLQLLFSIRQKVREALKAKQFSRLYEPDSWIGQSCFDGYLFTCWTFRKFIGKFDFRSFLSKILAEGTFQEIESETLFFMIPKVNHYKVEGSISLTKDIDFSENFKEFKQKLKLKGLKIIKQIIKREHNENGNGNGIGIGTGSTQKSRNISLDDVLEDSSSYLNDFSIFTKNSEILSNSSVNFRCNIKNPAIYMANVLGLKASCLNELSESNAKSLNQSVSQAQVEEKQSQEQKKQLEQDERLQKQFEVSNERFMAIFKERQNLERTFLKDLLQIIQNVKKESAINQDQNP